jgi:hypothetical protein
VEQRLYPKGEITQVEILDGGSFRDYVLHDVTNKRFITGVPNCAFRFIDSEATPATDAPSGQ